MPKKDLNGEGLGLNLYEIITSNNKNFGGKTYVKYNYVFSKLSKNLDKEASKQNS